MRFNFVMGKCYLVHSENLQESVQEWSAKGPNRFYFSETYNSQTEEFTDPSPQACTVGKSKKKGNNLKSKSKKIENNSVETIPSFPKISKKLKSLDVFAGCGGNYYRIYFSSINIKLFTIIFLKVYPKV